MPIPSLSRASSTTILALAACALAAPAADAQVSPGRTDVSGTVVDARTGAPLPGATVRFINLRRSAATDEAGRFEFRNVPAGEQPVSIGSIGYEAAMEL
jgi:iron complex outermembrane recepter protein